ASSAAAAGGMPPAGPSPLEVVLGIRPGQAAAQAHAPEPKKTASAEPVSGADDGPAPAERPDATQAASAAAAQGWWDMLQKQFDTLAAATAATLQSAEAARAAAQASDPASSRSTLGQASRKTAKKAARSA